MAEDSESIAEDDRAELSADRIAPDPSATALTQSSDRAVYDPDSPRSQSADFDTDGLPLIQGVDFHLVRFAWGGPLAPCRWTALRYHGVQWLPFLDLFELTRHSAPQVCNSFRAVFASNAPHWLVDSLRLVLQVGVPRNWTSLSETALSFHSRGLLLCDQCGCWNSKDRLSEHALELQLRCIEYNARMLFITTCHACGHNSTALVIYECQGCQRDLPLGQVYCGPCDDTGQS